MSNRRQDNAARLESIEPRILFSADLSPLLLDAPDPGDAVETRSLDGAGEFEAVPFSAESTTRTEIVILDERVENVDRLIHDLRDSAGIERQLEFVLLDADRDGIAQISEALASRADVAAVHLISHGDDGHVQLGNAVLDFDALLASASQIKAWGQSLSQDADILIYGCDVAATEGGRSLIDALSRLTGADVAGSDDLTGNAALGGDWDLEYRAGTIDAMQVFDADETAGWMGVLAISSNGTVTSASTDGATSLSWSHTVSAGTNRVLVVELAIDGAGANTTSVTYGGVAMTQIGRGAGNHAVELWALVNPAAGTANVVATFAGTTAAAGGATAYNGVNQSVPFGTFVSATGTGTTASVTVASAAGDQVIDVQYWEGSPSGGAPGPGQALSWWQIGSAMIGGGTVEAGAASVVMSGSFSTSTQWEIGAVSMRAAPVVNTAPVFTGLSGGVAFTENSAPVVLDADVTIADGQLSADDNFSGATLTLMRNGGASAQDTFTASGTLSPLAQGSPLAVGGTTIGAVTVNSGGTLMLTFNAGATNSLVNAAMQQIAYANTSDAPPTSVEIDWTFNDGNAGAQGSGGALLATGSKTVTIAAVNDAPTGGPTISGIATEDQTFSALTDSIADADGLGAFSYQWLRDGVAISGAISSSYVLVQADVGANISVNVSYTDGQGTAESLSSLGVGPVANVNDAPVVAASGGAVQYDENAVPLTLDASLSISDVDSATLTGAIVRISAGYAGAEDALAFSNQLGITGSWDGATGILTLSGTASVADYATALRSVTYVNTSDDPSIAARTVEFVVNDGALDSAPVVRQIQVVAFNDLPVLDLDADDSSGVGGSDYEVQFVEGGGPVPIIDADASVIDVDSANLTGLTVSIANLFDSGYEILTADVSGTSIAAAFDPNSGVLTLSGSDSTGNYQQVLRTIRYENTSPNPDFTDRQLWIRADDNSLGYSNDALATIHVVPGSVPPGGAPATGSTSTGYHQELPPSVLLLPTVLPDLVHAAPTVTAALDTALAGPADPRASATIGAEERMAGATSLDEVQDEREVADSSLAGSSGNAGARFDGAAREGYVARLMARLDGFAQAERTPIHARQAAGDVLGNADFLLQLTSDFGEAGRFVPSAPNGWQVQSAFDDGQDDPDRRELEVLIDSVKFGGLALSVGAVWWASRLSGLVGSMLASAPAWRHMDPLPVLGRGNGEDDEGWCDVGDKDADANELAISLVLEGAPAPRGSGVVR